VPPQVRARLARRVDSRAGRPPAPRVRQRPDAAPGPDPTARLVPPGWRSTRHDEPGATTVRSWP